jgi:hypothetical protein
MNKRRSRGDLLVNVLNLSSLTLDESEAKSEIDRNTIN